MGERVPGCPTIADARRLRRRYPDVRAVVVLFCTDEVIGAVSEGRDREWCRGAGELCDAVHEAAMALFEEWVVERGEAA